MRTPKSSGKEIPEKSNIYSSATMNEAATLRLVMEQNLAETDERCHPSRRNRYPYQAHLNQGTPTGH